MRLTPSLWRLLENDLRCWASQPASLWAAAISVGIVVLGISGAGAHGGPLFRSVLGGPQVAIIGGRLVESSEWVWFVTNVLFVVVTFGLVETGSGWTRLTVLRGASRTRWAAARLASSAAGALLFLTALLSAMAAAAVTGWQHHPLISPQTTWDVGLWGLGLISLAWFQVAIEVSTGLAWLGFCVNLVVLGLARFGGPLAPYVPFAQSIYALHGLSGTLSIADGALYLALWSALSAGAALTATSLPPS